MLKEESSANYVSVHVDNSSIFPVFTNEYVNRIGQAFTIIGTKLWSILSHGVLQTENGQNHSKTHVRSIFRQKNYKNL